MLAACAACYTPTPVTPRPAAADVYQRAASPEPQVRAGAAAELTGEVSPSASQMLITLAQRDVDPGVRIAAAHAIEERHDPALDSVLEAQSQIDPDPNVRAAAAAAHQRLWAWGKSPRTATGLSILCPGCGQIYLGETGDGAVKLAATASLVISGLALIDGQTASLGSAATSAKAPIGLVLSEAGQDLWFYSIFDAYRDARILRGDAGYSHPISRETLPELASAPFRPSVLARPWVWAGVPLALGAGVAVSFLIGGPGSVPSINDVRQINVLGHNFGRAGGIAAGEGYFLTLFTGVGVGEEALFRGLIQTELMERMGTYGGLVAASAIFGAVHTLNYVQPGADPKEALVAVPVIAVLGSSLGLAYIHTGYKLETSVAMHFWYDFLLSTVGFMIDPTHQPFVVQYGTAM